MTLRDDLLGISLLVIYIKIFRKPSIKGKLRYWKINFFTTSALYKCIFPGLTNLEINVNNIFGGGGGN